MKEHGFLVNLIDSPGHIDFCSEVSTAARLTDGCLIVVDAVEGVCIQTHAVLRQAWEEKVCPCLVINKIDRLIVSLEMSPMEAYLRLKQIVSDVNMIFSAFESERFLNEANAVLAHEAAKEATERSQEESEGNEADAFSPIKGNVVFGSAIDGWGFGIQTFAEMYAEKLGASAVALNKALWGDFSFQPKTKGVIKIKQGTAASKPGKPMFVQFILEPLFHAYTSLEPGADFRAILTKIIKGRDLGCTREKALLAKDPKQLFKAVMSAWLPMADAILSMVIHHLPSPLEAVPVRMNHLLAHHKTLQTSLPAIPRGHFQKATNDLMSASSVESATCVIYVSKMIAVEQSFLPREAERRSTRGDVFLAFGRVFSGVARKGMRVHVLSGAYDPSQPFSNHRQTATLGQLYLMMGRGLELLEDVPAGNVLAIEGLDDVVHKSATLTTSPYCSPLVPMTFQSTAIVRVAVEPALPSELPKLEEGLKKLAKSDPFVEIEILSTGEHVVGAAGEVHLMTCLKDLKERYAMIQLEVSPPLVAFRETVIEDENEARVVETCTPTGACTFRVKAHPLPETLANLLSDSQSELSQVLVDKKARGAEEFLTRLQNYVEELPVPLQKLLRRAWLLGPKKTGPNLLLAGSTTGPSLYETSVKSVVQLDKKRAIYRPAMIIPVNLKSNGLQPDESDIETPSDTRTRTPTIREPDAASKVVDIRMQIPEAAQRLGISKGESFSDPSVELSPALKKIYKDMESGVVAGFQLATAAGPLCDEPIWGVAFEVDTRLSTTLDADGTAEAPEVSEDVYGPFHGQVMNAVKSCCRQALIEGNPRLVEALYLCEIASSAEFLSGVYSVIARRRGRILHEELREGSDMFIVHAYLPVEAAFGLAHELRSKSSGGASCSLLFSHWERLHVDPFFVPKTEEEREEFGDEINIDSTNLARRLIFSVRKRKGLVVQEKVVESATKQRTLAKKV